MKTPQAGPECPVDAQVLLLLRELRETGSINRSARVAGFSYATAWRRLRGMEAALAFPLLLPRTGGRGGGGTALTPEGESFLQKHSTPQSLSYKEGLNHV